MDCSACLSHPAMRELGFSLAVIMGAAGVLTVALGFASQTTASNLISGLFLIGERSFEIGDLIRVGTTTGEVLSIDALSVKLRTFDNLFVRIPNESLIKSEVTTLTRFPIRRLDLLLGVAYKEDIGRVQKVLTEVADRNPLCLDEPPPLFIFYRLWRVLAGYPVLGLDPPRELPAVEEQPGCRNQSRPSMRAESRFPFPHRTIYTGEATRPFPVVMVAPETMTDNEVNEWQRLSRPLLALGTPAPDFSLTDTISNRPISLDEIAGEKGTLIVFICNHCPFVKHLLDELVQVGKDYQGTGIGMAAISRQRCHRLPPGPPGANEGTGRAQGILIPISTTGSQGRLRAPTRLPHARILSV